MIAGKPILAKSSCGASVVTKRVTKSPCTAHSKQTGAPCKMNAEPGTKVCRYHGGLSPTLANRRAHAVARQAISDLALDLDEDDPERDPIEGFMREYRRTIAAIRYWDAEIAQIKSAHDLTFGMTKMEHVTATEFAGVNETYETKLNVAYTSRFLERQHLNDLVKTWLAGRMVEIADRREARILDNFTKWIDAVLVGLGHDPHDPKTRAVVTRVLEA